MVEIRDYEEKYLDEASGLLFKTQIKANREMGIVQQLSQDECKDLIQNELTKKVSSSLVLLDDGKLVAYVIAVVTEDKTWGNFGWVSLGAWAIEEEYSYYLGLLYQKIGKAWADRGVHKHVFLVYSYLQKTIERFNELGFAKQQAHGLLKSADMSSIAQNDELTVRRGEETDQPQINEFSRIIPLFQQESPCFAPAPENYLKELDEGFSDLTTDEEGELYVVEKNNRILGYQLFYPVEKGNLLEPENSVELAVSSVKGESRGTGAGLELTRYAINEQIGKGKNLFVTDWRCANLLSSKFWQDIGFKPIAYRIYRHIDTLLELS